MLTPEKYLEQEWQVVDSDADRKAYRLELRILTLYHKALIQSIIDDLEANRNKNAVEYLKSKL